MRNTDLEQELISYAKSDYYPFHMPGHKRRKLSDYTPEEIDITEIEGFDNLHQAQGLIREGQERLAELFGAGESFYLVNGSTAGILAAVCASVKRGGRILIGRNSHRAAYHAAYLSELRTEYVYPQKTAFGIQGSIRPGDVERKLAEFPDTEAVLITSPTYDGVVSDIGRIGEIVHAKGIPLIVDEAHGAHFGFSELFPQKALAVGADLVVESLHKTLPAYTQTAALHVGKNSLADTDRIRRYLDIFQTSSPSYVFMAGIERCVRMLREDKKELFDAFAGRLRAFYHACEGLRFVRVLSGGDADPGIWKRDISKILITAQDAGFHGQQLYEILLKKYHLQMEMAAGHYVTALTGIMDTEEGFARLAEALREIDASGRERGCPVRASLTPEELYEPREKRMEIFEALDAGAETVPLSEAAGRISADFISLYPPGIPLAAPGETITEELAEAIRACLACEMQVQGLDGGCRVVKT